MKATVMLIIIFLCISGTGSGARNEEKIELQKLVDEREARFGEYSRAAGTKSGFFGNQTKNDLRVQVDVLTEIIKTDNRIISLLKNFLENKTFQRTEMVYSQAELDEKNRRLDELSTSLSKQLQQTKTASKSMAIDLKWARFMNWLLLIALAVTGYMLWKRR